jgi:hypothetical protein
MKGLLMGLFVENICSTNVHMKAGADFFTARLALCGFTPRVCMKMVVSSIPGLVIPQNQEKNDRNYVEQKAE